jgi:hypothetical protein
MTPSERRSARCIEPRDAAVHCPDGRWGPRRTRVDECYAILCAEDLYTELLAANTQLKTNWRGQVKMSVSGRTFILRAEVRSNAIWRAGRLFYLCPCCSRRRSRLYLPTEDAAAVWCRLCWGLSYESRQRNYKDDLAPGGALFGLTYRLCAANQTELTRVERAQISRERRKRRQR